LLKAICAVSIGAALGALLRWVLGLKLNALAPNLPPGTLAANLIGGYIVGVLVALFADMPQLSAEWRLFLITGFCGGLTTFSSFSAEVVLSITEGRLATALTEIGLHLGGSLLMTVAGVYSWRWWRAL